MLRLYVKLMLCWAVIQTAAAQDVHFSAIRQIPYFFNPAYTGYIEQDVRAGLIYRNQSPTYTKAFNTLGYGVDFSVLKQKTDNRSIIGVGVNGYYDRAGALNFTDNAFMANFSYIQALDKKKKFYLSFGIQAGYSFRKIDLSKAIFEEGFNGDNGFSSTPGDLNVADAARNRHVNLGTGIIAFFNINKKIKFHVGFAGADLAVQNLSFISDKTVKQKPRMTANFGLEANVGHLSILPYFLAQMKLPENEIVFGSILRYNSDEGQFDNSDNLYSIGGGIGYRHLDAILLSAQANYKSISMNFTYDINISKWSRASKTVGALEISIVYQASFLPVKDKKYKRLDCAKFTF